MFAQELPGGWLTLVKRELITQLFRNKSKRGNIGDLCSVVPFFCLRDDDWCYFELLLLVSRNLY